MSENTPEYIEARLEKGEVVFSATFLRENFSKSLENFKKDLEEDSDG